MPAEDELFADADSSLEDAGVVIFGAPYDGTVSHRPGTKLGPDSIRKESYNFETYLVEYGIDLTSIAIHDAGNLSFEPTTQAALDKMNDFAGTLTSAGKFPVMLGGEHSLTVGTVKGLLEHFRSVEEVKPNQPPFGVIVLDAHLDFRMEYEGERYSHACVTRRLTDLLGIKNVIPVGVRSMSAEEHRDAAEAGLKYYDVQTATELGAQMLIEDILELLDSHRIYLSFDMDALDPAFAPGVGNPEPFGLPDTLVRDTIEKLAPNLVGFDIMEISPPYDNGNTAALAARLVRNVIALQSSAQK
jgi:agmatinase